MENTELRYGTEVIIEVKSQNNLLPSMYPNATGVETYVGILQKRANYDEKDSFRLVCSRGPMKLRVIAMRNVLSFNGQPFRYTPTPKTVKSGPKTVEVEGSKGKKYTLTIQPNGSIMCNCTGFGFRGKCHHVDDYVKEQNK